MIDWKKAEESAGGNFAPLAEKGFYKVKIENIDIRETKNAKGETTYWLDFLLAEDGNKFPKISHPISRRNLNWTAYHFMSILKELGISEDKAKKAIELAEDKKGEDNIIAAYFSTFERAIAKNPEVEIEVYESDNINPNSGRPYMRADFKNPKIGFGKTTTKKEETGNVLDEGEEITDNSLNIPF